MNEWPPGTRDIALYISHENAEPPLPDSRWEARDTPEPVPVCPECGGMLRRDSVGPSSTGSWGSRHFWRCDLHGEVNPRWEEPHA